VLEANQTVEGRIMNVHVLVSKHAESADKAKEMWFANTHACLIINCDKTLSKAAKLYTAAFTIVRLIEQDLGPTVEEALAMIGETVRDLGESFDVIVLNARSTPQMQVWEKACYETRHELLFHFTEPNCCFESLPTFVKKCVYDVGDKGRFTVVNKPQKLGKLAQGAETGFFIVNSSGKPVELIQKHFMHEEFELEDLKLHYNLQSSVSQLYLGDAIVFVPLGEGSLFERYLIYDPKVCPDLLVPGCLHIFHNITLKAAQKLRVRVNSNPSLRDQSAFVCIVGDSSVPTLPGYTQVGELPIFSSTVAAKVENPVVTSLRNASVAVLRVASEAYFAFDTPAWRKAVRAVATISEAIHGCAITLTVALPVLSPGQLGSLEELIRVINYSTCALQNVGQWTLANIGELTGNVARDVLHVLWGVMPEQVNAALASDMRLLGQAVDATICAIREARREAADEIAAASPPDAVQFIVRTRTVVAELETELKFRVRFALQPGTKFTLTTGFPVEKQYALHFEGPGPETVSPVSEPGAHLQDSAAPLAGRQHVCDSIIENGRAVLVLPPRPEPYSPCWAIISMVNPDDECFIQHDGKFHFFNYELQTEGHSWDMVPSRRYKCMITLDSTLLLKLLDKKNMPFKFSCDYMAESLQSCLDKHDTSFVDLNMVDMLMQHVDEPCRPKRKGDAKTKRHAQILFLDKTPTSFYPKKIRLTETYIDRSMTIHRGDNVVLSA